MACTGGRSRGGQRPPALRHETAASGPKLELSGFVLSRIDLFCSVVEIFIWPVGGGVKIDRGH